MNPENFSFLLNSLFILFKLSMLTLVTFLRIFVLLLIKWNPIFFLYCSFGAYWGFDKPMNCNLTFKQPLQYNVNWTFISVMKCNVLIKNLQLHELCYFTKGNAGVKIHLMFSTDEHIYHSFICRITFQGVF